MSYYIKRCDMPTWHNYYDASSEVYVNPFALSNSNNNSNYKINSTTPYLNDIGNYSSLNKIPSVFTNGGIYKGCGLNFEGPHTSYNFAGPDATFSEHPQTKEPLPNTPTTRDIVLTRDRTTNTLKITEQGVVKYTIPDAPILCYFEACAGGGGGGGGNGNVGGGGGGGGAGVSGILDFSNTTAFSIKFGGSGGGSPGYVSFGNDYVDTSSTRYSKNRGNTTIYPNANFSGNCLRLTGGQGGYSYNGGYPEYTTRSVNGGVVETYTHPVTGTLSKLNYYAYILNSTIFVMQAHPGGKGGSSGNSESEAIKKGGDVDGSQASNLTLKNGSTHVVDQIVYKNGGSPGKHPTYGTQPRSGGGGGASLYGNGGTGGFDAYVTSASPSGYGGGGGGGDGNYDAYVLHGGTGAPGKFTLYCTPVSNPSAVAAPSGKKVVVLNIIPSNTDLKYFSLAYNFSGNDLSDDYQTTDYNYKWSGRIEFTVDKSVNKLWAAVITGRTANIASEMPKGYVPSQWLNLDNDVNEFTFNNVTFS